MEEMELVLMFCFLCPFSLRLRTPTGFLPYRLRELSMHHLVIIVAATKANGIGQNSTLPWKLMKEMKYFARVTTFAPEGTINAVIMGKNTWESIPERFRPLPKRLNIVLSTDSNYQLCVASYPRYATSHLHYPRGNPTAKLSSDLSNALAQTRSNEIPIHKVFIIGGASVYAETLQLGSAKDDNVVDHILLTRILFPDFDGCNTFMPDFAQNDARWTKASHRDLECWVGFEVPEGVQTENGVDYEFQLWKRDA